MFFIASDRYVSSVGFAVRSMEFSSNEDVLGSVTGLKGGGTKAADSYMIVKYLESRDLLDELMLEFDFSKIYGGENVDFLSRLSKNNHREDTLNYWNWYINPSFDPSSGIIYMIFKHLLRMMLT